MARFKLEEIDRVAKQVSRKAEYPIRDADELLEALGGKNATVKYEGKDRKAEDVRRIPQEVFPIESEIDFVAKIATLRARGGDEAEGMEKGKEVP
jgi:hypothetical protein